MTLTRSVRLLAAGALLLAPAVRSAAAQAPATAVANKAPAAGARAHDLDRAHSEINFTASSRLLDAHGFFDKWDADIQLDPEALEKSSVKLTIDVNSINTRVERRDQHLKSADFFDAAKYPTITFVSKSITKASPTTGTITGDLTIRGVTKQVAVPVSMVFYQNGRGRFRGTFEIKRKDFGVSYDSGMNPIQDAVEVQFNISLAEKKA